MQPLRFATDAETGFVHVFHRGLGHLLAHTVDQGLTPCAIVLVDPGNVAVVKRTPWRSAMSMAKRFSGSNWWFCR